VKESGAKIPFVIERLITVIEMNGIYTVGLYRKPGVAAQIKALIKDINKDASKVDLNDYPVHVLTSVLKAFFRELTEPVMTFELYNEFLRSVGDLSSEMSDFVEEREKLKSLMTVVEKLPQPNRDLLERLVFHLAKVAQQETSNKMSASALAIIFAPSILRTEEQLSTQESLTHVPRQTICLRLLIEAQMKKIRTTLEDIKQLDSESVFVHDRLLALRESRRVAKKDFQLVPRDSEEADSLGADEEAPPSTPDEERAEMRMLSQQILSLQDERDQLTNDMPSLDFRISVTEEDELSVDDVDSTGDELDSDEMTNRTLSYNKMRSFFFNLSRDQLLQGNESRRTLSTVSDETFNDAPSVMSSAASQSTMNDEAFS